MAGKRTSRFVACVVAAVLCGCTTGGGTGAPPLERFAMLPVQMIAFPFMIIRPFAPLIQSAMQVGMQMAPYAMLFCQGDTGPSGMMFAGPPGRESDELPLSLPMIEAILAGSGKAGVEQIVAIDLREAGGGDNLRDLVSAMEKKGTRSRCVIVNAGDIIFDDASLARLKVLLMEKSVSLRATGGLSDAIAGCMDDG